MGDVKRVDQWKVGGGQRKISENVCPNIWWTEIYALLEGVCGNWHWKEKQDAESPKPKKDKFNYFFS